MKIIIKVVRWQSQLWKICYIQTIVCNSRLCTFLNPRCFCLALLLQVCWHPSMLQTHSSISVLDILYIRRVYAKAQTDICTVHIYVLTHALWIAHVLLYIRMYVCIQHIISYVCTYVYYLYKCDYLIPIHIHPCKYNNSFHQY